MKGRGSNGKCMRRYEPRTSDLFVLGNHLPIVVLRPYMKAIFSPRLLSPSKFTHRVIHHLAACPC